MQGTVNVITQNKRSVTWLKSDIITLMENIFTNPNAAGTKISILNIDGVFYRESNSQTYTIYYTFETEYNKSSATFYMSDMEGRMRDLQLNKIL